MKQYNQFYKKTQQERIDILEKDQRFEHRLNTALPPETYTHMVENAITTYEIPLGVATGFRINEKDYIVPMATEEPSVIAAASNAAKIIAKSGGFSAKVISRQMRGEIAFDHPKDPVAMQLYVDTHIEQLTEIANNAHPSIVKRGGGIRHIFSEYINQFAYTDFFIIRISVDTQEAMGANITNTILEALALHLELQFNQTPLMSILSNLADECLVEARCEIDPSDLKEPLEIADKIESASHLAHIDPYRCATHNKGVMNGITALVLASGNDTRAIESSMYSYAKGEPFTQWTKNKKKLVGTITIPMPIGFVGGSIGINPKAQLVHKILNVSSAQELMMVIASVGLAQNFAALYALTTDGIQKGHMSLQAKSLALSAGATDATLEQVTKHLLNEKHMNLESAKRIIESLKKQTGETYGKIL